MSLHLDYIRRPRPLRASRRCWRIASLRPRLLTHLRAVVPPHLTTFHAPLAPRLRSRIAAAILAGLASPMATIPTHFPPVLARITPDRTPDATNRAIDHPTRPHVGPLPYDDIWAGIDGRRRHGATPTPSS